MSSCQVDVIYSHLFHYCLHFFNFFFVTIFTDERVCYDCRFGLILFISCNMFSIFSIVVKCSVIV